MKQTYLCEDCSYSTQYSSNWKRHFNSQRHKANIKDSHHNLQTDNETNLAPEIGSYQCKVCMYNTPYPSNWKRHFNSQRHMQNLQIEHYQSLFQTAFTSHQTQNNQLSGQISQLQKQITELMSSKTSNVNNNYNIAVNNLQPLTDEDISEHIGRLSIDFILQGAKGYADFANKYPFKNHIICTDKARKKIKYKNANGEIVDDPQGRQLTHKFFQTFADKNRQLINTEYRNLQQRVQEIAKGGDAETSDLVGILSKATRLQEILQSCNEAAEGKDNKFTQEFVNHLTKMI